MIVALCPRMIFVFLLVCRAHGCAFSSAKHPCRPAFTHRSTPQAPEGSVPHRQHQDLHVRVRLLHADICMYVCMYVYVCVCVYIYTYIQHTTHVCSTSSFVYCVRPPQILPTLGLHTYMQDSPFRPVMLGICECDRILCAPSNPACHVHFNASAGT